MPIRDWSTPQTSAEDPNGPKWDAPTEEALVIAAEEHGQGCQRTKARNGSADSIAYPVTCSRMDQQKDPQS